MQRDPHEPVCGNSASVPDPHFPGIFDHDSGGYEKILGAQSSHIEITFPYFIAKQSPSAGVSGLMDYTCSIIGSSNSGHPTDIILKVAVPVTSVCPCSKAISDCGAHNQRGEVLVSTRFKN